ncbi:hypothetical protein [Paracidovorax konjaci]|uniref:Uncharacterized protein n=1 Tax=Paracidovorax konjaci TaxID=32040 RepID=A0A1I1XUS8_9BURK|nr:hypothetical protein [Paracidovorax konjaci]SFE11105.1 hypothetical protein SAMN04489710_114137 [Paracidovorax konjaci]
MVLAIMWGLGVFFMAFAFARSMIDKVDNVRRHGTNVMFYAGVTAFVAGPVVSTIVSIAA